MKYLWALFTFFARIFWYKLKSDLAIEYYYAVLLNRLLLLLLLLSLLEMI